MAVRKFQSGLINTVLVDNYVGEKGHIFYDPLTGEFRISDGRTPGGKPIAPQSKKTLFIPAWPPTYVLPNAIYKVLNQETGTMDIWETELDGTVYKHTDSNIQAQIDAIDYSEIFVNSAGQPITPFN
jgi:hypothetical protein